MSGVRRTYYPAPLLWKQLEELLPLRGEWEADTEDAVAITCVLPVAGHLAHAIAEVAGVLQRLHDRIPLMQWEAVQPEAHLRGRYPGCDTVPLNPDDPMWCWGPCSRPIETGERL